MQFSSLLFHQDFVKQLKGAESQQRIQLQREMTNHGVQALFDATLQQKNPTIRRRSGN